jgi:ribosome-binding factor A
MMTAKKRTSQKQMASLCGEIRPEDGIDPRDLARQPRQHKGDRKVRQLCSQVAETLSLVLSGECSDELLQNLEVVAVDPAPNASQLLVTVRSADPDAHVNSAEVSARLTAIAGKLRCEVASAITRKRAPSLVFRVL